MYGVTSVTSRRDKLPLSGLILKVCATYPKCFAASIGHSLVFSPRLGGTWNFQ